MASLLLAGASVGQPVAGDTSAMLSSDTAVATAGYFQLQWQADEAVRLIEATSGDFSDASVVYTGSDSGHMVSGRRDGELHYRLESAATGATIGGPISVQIAHHPLSRALSFFAVGAAVFLATAAMILIAGRRSTA